MRNTIIRVLCIFFLVVILSLFSGLKLTQPVEVYAVACNSVIANFCAGRGQQCANNQCIIITPTPTVNATPPPTPTPATFKCNCSGAFSTCGNYQGYTNVKQKLCSKNTNGTIDCIKVNATYHQVVACPNPTDGPTSTPTVNPTATPSTCRAAIANVCAALHKICINNVCVTPTSTPAVSPTVGPTNTPSPTPTPVTFKCNCSRAFSTCGNYQGYTNVKQRLCSKNTNGTIDCIKVNATYHQVVSCDPTGTPAPSPTGGAACAKKDKGDADCNGAIDAVDYEAWKCEFLGGGTCSSSNTSVSTNLTSDFNADGAVTIVDFEIFRKNLFE